MDLAQIEAEAAPKLKLITVGVVRRRKYTPEEQKARPIIVMLGRQQAGLMSYDEIGAKIGVTHEGARQICERAIAKLRTKHPEVCRQLLALSNERHKCLYTIRG